jgi:hypothetical protein
VSGGNSPQGARGKTVSIELSIWLVLGCFMWLYRREDGEKELGLWYYYIGIPLCLIVGPLIFMMGLVERALGIKDDDGKA